MLGALSSDLRLLHIMDGSDFALRTKFSTLRNGLIMENRDCQYFPTITPQHGSISISVNCMVRMFGFLKLLF